MCLVVKTDVKEAFSSLPNVPIFLLCSLSQLGIWGPPALGAVLTSDVYHRAFCSCFCALSCLPFRIHRHSLDFRLAPHRCSVCPVLRASIGSSFQILLDLFGLNNSSSPSFFPLSPVVHVT